MNPRCALAGIFPAPCGGSARECPLRPLALRADLAELSKSRTSGTFPMQANGCLVLHYLQRRGALGPRRAKAQSETVDPRCSIGRVCLNHRCRLQWWRSETFSSCSSAPFTTDERMPASSRSTSCRTNQFTECATLIMSSSRHLRERNQALRRFSSGGRIFCSSAYFSRSDSPNAIRPTFAAAQLLGNGLHGRTTQMALIFYQDYRRLWRDFAKPVRLMPTRTRIPTTIHRVEIPK